MAVKVIHKDTWEKMSWDAKRPTDVAVRLVDSNNKTYCYAWSPDGEGAFYYETLAELQSEH